MSDSPRVLPILAMLIEAGDAGMLGPDLARRFTEPVLLQRRLSRLNQHLHRLRGYGNVRRAARQEPSPHYNNVGAYRWYITELGTEYYKSGGYIARLSEQKEAAKRAAKSRAEYAELLLLWEQVPVPATMARRDEQICEMFADGLSMPDIGSRFNLTRERIRQILNSNGKYEPKLRHARSDRKRTPKEFEEYVARVVTECNSTCT